MTLYEVIVDLAKKDYDKIKVDLTTKGLRVGKQDIIANGFLLQDKIKVGDDVYEFDKLIEKKFDLDELYAQYKTSVPSERDNGMHYFKALSANELSDGQLVCNMPRLEARVRLEAYVLLAGLSEMLELDGIGTFYWQGKDKDFIILKKFI